VEIVIPNRVDILEGCLLMVNHDYVPHLMPLGLDSLPVGSLAKHVHQLYGLVLPIVNHDCVHI